MQATGTECVSFFVGRRKFKKRFELNEKIERSEVFERCLDDRL
jgi:hypothetical protein